MRFPGRANRTQWRQPPLRRSLQAVLSMPEAAETGPATRFIRRRSTASEYVKISFFYSRGSTWWLLCQFPLDLVRIYPSVLSRKPIVPSRNNNSNLMICELASRLIHLLLQNILVERQFFCCYQNVCVIEVLIHAYVVHNNAGFGTHFREGMGSCVPGCAPT